MMPTPVLIILGSLLYLQLLSQGTYALQSCDFSITGTKKVFINDSSINTEPTGHPDSLCKEVAFIQDRYWRCEMRYCCSALLNEPCSCDATNIQEDACTDPTQQSQVYCKVEHVQPRFERTVCCTGYERDSNNECVHPIDCDSDLGPRCDHLCVKHNATHHTCECKPGYEKIGKTVCQDVDECETIANCQQMCRNTPGSFECLCDAGYVTATDGKSCNDIDECSTGQHNCEHECENTPGSFLCSCHAGYELDTANNQCKDIDECYTGVAACDQGCQNSPGGYSCHCLQGFTLDEVSNTCRQDGGTTSESPIVIAPPAAAASTGLKKMTIIGIIIPLALLFILVLLCLVCVRYCRKKKTQPAAVIAHQNNTYDVIAEGHDIPDDHLILMKKKGPPEGPGVVVNPGFSPDEKKVPLDPPSVHPANLYDKKLPLDPPSVHHGDLPPPYEKEKGGPVDNDGYAVPLPAYVQDEKKRPKPDPLYYEAEPVTKNSIPHGGARPKTPSPKQLSQKHNPNHYDFPKGSGHPYYNYPNSNAPQAIYAEPRGRPVSIVTNQDGEGRVTEEQNEVNEAVESIYSEIN